MRNYSCLVPDKEVIIKNGSDEIWHWKFYPASQFRWKHKPGGKVFYPTVIGRIGEYLNGRYRLQVTLRVKGTSTEYSAWITDNAKYHFFTMEEAWERINKKPGQEEAFPRPGRGEKHRTVAA